MCVCACGVSVKCISMHIDALLSLSLTHIHTLSLSYTHVFSLSLSRGYVCLYVYTTHLLLRQHKAGILRQMCDGRIQCAQLPGKKVLLGLLVVVEQVL